MPKGGRDQTLGPAIRGENRREFYRMNRWQWACLLEPPATEEFCHPQKENVGCSDSSQDATERKTVDNLITLQTDIVLSNH